MVRYVIAMKDCQLGGPLLVMLNGRAARYSSLLLIGYKNRAQRHGNIQHCNSQILRRIYQRLKRYASRVPWLGLGDELQGNELQELYKFASHLGAI